MHFSYVSPAVKFHTIMATFAFTTDSACLQPLQHGECDGIFPRYYFSTSSGQCEEFIWGGCGGNANNFITLEACITECGKS